MDSQTYRTQACLPTPHCTRRISHLKPYPYMIGDQVNAISRQDETSALIIDSDICIGCEMCASACPLGTISIDTESQKPLLCDLCGGKPMCTQFCPTEAIKYTTATKASLNQRRSSFKKVTELIKQLPAK